jgi:multidrug resistance protein, MATE family
LKTRHRCQSLSEPEENRFRAVKVSHAAVLRLALPMTLAHMSTPLLGFADATVIGRLGQAHLLGAIAAAAVIFDFIFWGFGFLRMGTAGLTAQALGSGDPTEQSATLIRALLLAGLIGLALIVLQEPIAWIGFHSLGASPEVTQAARAYYDIRIWSAPFVLANYAVVGAITGRGRTDIALGLQVFINLVNIALNVWLVYGLTFGVRGSAAGTLIAEALGTLAGFFVIARLKLDLFAIERRLVLERTRLMRMISINRDIMIRTAALIFAFAFFTAQGARGGDVALAANAILMNLFLATAYFLDGFATAASQMCGQSLGAHDANGFRAAVRVTSFWCLAFAACISTVSLIGGRFFIDFVTTNAEVRAFAQSYLIFAAATPLAGALAFELDGVFIGATWTRDMRNMMLLALTIYISIFFALRPFGNKGLWIALLLFFVARGLGLLWRYRALVAASFPLAQSAAATPVTSASRG